MSETTLTHRQYLTVGEVAEDLRIARMTVYRMIKRGDLQAIEVGRRTFRIPAESYAAYKAALHTAAARRAATAQAPAHIPGQTEFPA